MRERTRVDPITVEVIRNYYQSSARQMRSVLARASFNPVIYEMLDFSLGLYTRNAELIAEGPGIPLFMGTLTFSIRNVVEYLGEQNLEDGDVILSTYPYWTGSHSQDAVIIRPIFVDGRVFGYAAAKAHWMDIGAIDIYGVDTTDIWQEGLQLYGVKIHKAGKLDREIAEIVRANTRIPDGVVGDMNAQISACNVGAAKVVELTRKYGSEVVEGAIEQILDHGERITRQAIAEIPDGEWSAEGALDDNGLGEGPVRIKLTIRVEGDRMIMDTTGSAGQQRGPVNCPYPTTVSAARLALKMLTTPRYDANEGCFRPLEVISPAGSLLNATAPAPVYLYGWSAIVMGELAFKALADVIPDRVVARSGGDMCGALFSGTDPETGAFFAGGADEAVGQGASHDRDGESAVILYSLGESRNVPAEVIEERYPVLVERYALRQDSGGPGRFRGGLGVEKFWRAEADLRFLAIVEQSKAPAWGLFGGKDAHPNVGILNPGTDSERRIGKISGYPLAKNGSWHLHTGGGGGWGNPLERDPSAVLADVTAGYVSVGKARDDYGVAVELVDGEYVLDELETSRLRKHAAPDAASHPNR